MTRGRHTWKTGFQWMHYRVNYLQSNVPRGSVYFHRRVDRQRPQHPGRQRRRPCRFSFGRCRRTPTAPSASRRLICVRTLTPVISRTTGASPARLTVNFGVRYEYFAPFTDARNQLLNLDYSTLPQAAAPDAPWAPRGQPDRNNFAPRVGLAWTPPISFWPGRKMVFRAGYGIYFSSGNRHRGLQPGAEQHPHRDQPDQTASAPLLTLENGFPQTSSTGFPTLTMDSIRTRPLRMCSSGTPASNRSFPPASCSKSPTSAPREPTSASSAISTRRRTSRPARTCRRGPETCSRCGRFPSSAPSSRCQHIGQLFVQFAASSKPRSAWARVSRSSPASFGRNPSTMRIRSSPACSIASARRTSAICGSNAAFLSSTSAAVSARGYVYNLPGAGGFLRPVLRNWQTSGIVTIQDGTPQNPFYFALRRRQLRHRQPAQYRARPENLAAFRPAHAGPLVQHRGL